MFLLVIHVVLLPTQHLCFDTQKFYWAYAASPVHILYGRRPSYITLIFNRNICPLSTLASSWQSTYIIHFCDLQFSRETFARSQHWLRFVTSHEVCLLANAHT